MADEESEGEDMDLVEPPFSSASSAPSPSLRTCKRPASPTAGSSEEGEISEAEGRGCDECGRSACVVTAASATLCLLHFQVGSAAPGEGHVLSDLFDDDVYNRELPLVAQFKARIEATLLVELEKETRDAEDAAADAAADAAWVAANAGGFSSSSSSSSSGGKRSVGWVDRQEGGGGYRGAA